MIAGLSFYDWPGTEPAVRALAAVVRPKLVAAGLGDVEFLAPGDDQRSIWRRPDMLFAQTCGYPFVSDLNGHVRQLMTPHYRVSGCEGPYYSSALVARGNARMNGVGAGAVAAVGSGTGAPPEVKLADFAGTTAAINGWDSQSGCISLFSAVADLGADGDFFRTVAVTGAHARSVAAVAEGRADIAAIDAVCWAQAKRTMPAVTAGLTVIGFTEPTPGLPYIVPIAQSAATTSLLRAILSEALEDQATSAAREILFLGEASQVPDAAYNVILDMAERARPLIGRWRR